jgi:hypothetical protein
MMSKRKQTPDVLAEILGGEAASIEESPGRPAGSDNRRPEAWEYRLVSFQDYHGWRPRYLNGRELKDWTNGPLIHDYIQSMGDEGWELLTASAGERLYGSADNHQLYFKRLK